jgi:hypothetical protein
MLVKREFPLALSFKVKHVICQKRLPQTSSLSIAHLRDMLEEAFHSISNGFSFINCNSEGGRANSDTQQNLQNGVVT